ncbi:hypothetical protein NUW58_g4324 [Xylaria curta]|uniref:Uncharacterized protein n=1 Tax=Xylaria curta TaxID=42375 RepID=A0ACC1P6W2_9PEZI|nr:hypothetical protein NUW58_g4324 [Xylaria curta]
MANKLESVWRASTSILGALLAGILTAVGHHLYYASLQGTSPEGDRMIAGYRLSNQTFTTAVGTAFAFVVRAFLLFGVSGAYVQVFWHAATHARKGGNTLEEVDAMFSILSNLFAFRQGSVWWKYPMLLIIAFIAWLLPIAFIIPPGSISVMFAPAATSALETVPNFDFASLRYVDSMPRVGTTPVDMADGSHDVWYKYGYNGPSTEVQKVANAVAVGGTILPIAPPAANSSWQLDFYGPSISCRLMNNDTRIQVESHIAHWLWGRFLYCISCHCKEPIGYFAWSNDEGDETNPFKQDNETLKMSQVGSSSFLAVIPDHVALDGTGDDICTKANLTTKFYPLGPGNRTFLQCDLRNASYHAAFSYETGKQSIAVQVEHMEVVPTMNMITLPNISDPASGPYIVNASLLQHLSYTAVADAFWQLIKGSVLNGLKDRELRIDTKISSTVLLDTPELSFLSSRDWDSPLPSTLQGELWYTNTSTGQSLSSPRNVQLGESLQNALEEMFQNITISLISSELLQPIYQYSSRELWIAYGVAIVVSAVASLLGLLTSFLSNASYSNGFSSVYRTAHNSRLDVTMQAEDMKGTDPLPRYLAKATLYITNPASIAQPMPGDEHRVAPATATKQSSEALIKRDTETAEGEDTEPQAVDHSNAESYVSSNQRITVG